MNAIEMDRRCPVTEGAAAQDDPGGSQGKGGQERQEDGRASGLAADWALRQEHHPLPSTSGLFLSI